MTIDNIKHMPNEKDVHLGLSVVIITRNEEHNIRDCIESVKWADEIIVVDCFSTDDTLKIAEDYPVRTFQNDNTNNWNINKQYGFGRAIKNWILSLDADERITEKLAEEIKSVITSSAMDGYYVSRKNYIGDKWLKHANLYPDWQLRLFRNGNGWFECKTVHERLMLNGEVGYLKEPMIHLNYRDWLQLNEKLNLYTVVMVEEMLRNNVKFVCFYPLNAVKKFFNDFFGYKKSNTLLYSCLMSRKHLCSKYELVWFIPFRPFIKFLMHFFLLQGFKDGMDGFIWSIFKAWSVFLIYVKYREIKHINQHTKFKR